MTPKRRSPDFTWRKIPRYSFLHRKYYNILQILEPVTLKDLAEGEHCGFKSYSKTKETECLVWRLVETPSRRVATCPSIVNFVSTVRIYFDSHPFSNGKNHLLLGVICNRMACWSSRCMSRIKRNNGIVAPVIQCL